MYFLLVQPLFGAARKPGAGPFPRYQFPGNQLLEKACQQSSIASINPEFKRPARKQTMKTKLTLLLLSAFGVPLSLLAQGTAFTYQGRLNDGASAANGSYDLVFSLYDAAGNGTQVGGSVTNAATGVTNGLFTATLDFGTGVFTGNACWLEIGVRTNGGGAFASLSPRQPLTASPYALYAPNAGAAANAGIANSVAPGSINTVALATGAVDSRSIADGSIAQNDLSPALASNTFWRLGGNAGTSAGANFLGTTDNQPLELRANNARGLRIEPVQDLSWRFSVNNLIGGSAGNYVAPGVAGSVLAGGGAVYSYSSETNSISADYSFLGGGRAATIQTGAVDSFLGGGVRNSIQRDAQRSFLGGGEMNSIQTNAQAAFLGGGYRNSIGTNSFYATLGGGYQNLIGPRAMSSVLGGGSENTHQAGVIEGFLGGGNRNTNGGTYGVLVGGQRNRIQEGALGAFIGGGSENTLETGTYGSFLGGGENNSIRTNAGHAVVVGGRNNSIGTGANWAFLGGGANNSISTSSSYSTLGGGRDNTNGGNYAFLGGGSGNTIQTNSALSVLGGGHENVIKGFATESVLGGGSGNSIEENVTAAFLGGGSSNTVRAFAQYSSMGGGNRNTNGGIASVVPGGQDNFAGGRFSFAAGQRAKAPYEGDFVWADSQPADFSAANADQFLVRARNGVGINKDNPATALDVNGTVTATAFAGSGSGLTSVIADQLDGQHGAFYQNAGNLNAGTLPDARLAANVPRTNQVWLVGGNAGTAAGVNFLGTTDNQPIEFKVKGLRALRLEPTTGAAANVIGGYAGNTIGSSNIGSVIAGGGNYGMGNSILADYSVIGGGYANKIEAVESGQGFSIIGGGFWNAVLANTDRIHDRRRVWEHHRNQRPQFGDRRRTA